MTQLRNSLIVTSDASSANLLRKFDWQHVLVDQRTLRLSVWCFDHHHVEILRYETIIVEMPALVECCGP